MTLGPGMAPAITAATAATGRGEDDLWAEREQLATQRLAQAGRWLSIIREAAEQGWVPVTSPRVIPSSPRTCPVCGRAPGLCCVNERGAVRRGGPHPERLALEQQPEGGAA